MKIYYGLKNDSIDITEYCFTQLMKNDIIRIPCGDNNRASYFTDPIFGIKKNIIIEIDNELTEYDDTKSIIINTKNNSIDITTEKGLNDKINEIHGRLQINYGSLEDELPEQKMVVRYLKGDEKVLEIGGNIGRNSLVIASILNDDCNLVTLECDSNIANQLKENRDLNHFHFHIESSALSNRKLIQIGWNTKPSDILEDGYNWVETIAFEELKNKYNIVFDTLVLDCEGSFYYILMDMPEILDNIKLIIMENDYYDISHKKYVDSVLTQHNFMVDYSECGGWGCCFNNFFEVWIKQ